MMKFENAMVFGIAGNFAGHLEQAGEAEDFRHMTCQEPDQPKALFPIYVPSESDSFLTVYPLSNKVIQSPNDADNLQIEPEVAVLFNVTYQEGKVSALEPTYFGAFNDCSIRRPNAEKISEKKNWGSASKGLADTFFEVDKLAVGGVMDRFRIASFHQRGDKSEAYGEDCPVSEYSYFHERLQAWIIDRMNNQQDAGPAEDIAAMLESAGYPEQVLIAIGATRYTEHGKTHFLQKDDISMVVVYDGERYSPQDITAMAQKNEFRGDGISAVVQKVI